MQWECAFPLNLLMKCHWLASNIRTSTKLHFSNQIGCVFSSADESIDYICPFFRSIFLSSQSFSFAPQWLTDVPVHCLYWIKISFELVWMPAKTKVKFNETPGFLLPMHHFFINKLVIHWMYQSSWAKDRIVSTQFLVCFHSPFFVLLNPFKRLLIIRISKVKHTFGTEHKKGSDR